MVDGTQAPRDAPQQLSGSSLEEPSDRGKPEQAPSQGPPASQATGRKTSHPGLKTLILGAVITSVVGAIINPDLIARLFAGSEGDARAGSVLERREDEPLEYKPVFDSTRALEMTVPAAWGAVNSTFEVAPDGIGLTAAPDPTKPLADWTQPRAYIGASKMLFDSWELSDLDDAELGAELKDRLRERDWSLDGCVLLGESEYRRAGYLGTYRRWRNCGYIGAEFWDLIAASREDSVVVVAQIQFRRPELRDVADRILAEFEVVPELIPTDVGARSEDQVVP